MLAKHLASQNWRCTCRCFPPVIWANVSYSGRRRGRQFTVDFSLSSFCMLYQVHLVDSFLPTVISKKKNKKKSQRPVRCIQRTWYGVGLEWTCDRCENLPNVVSIDMKGLDANPYSNRKASVYKGMYRCSTCSLC